MIRVYDKMVSDGQSMKEKDQRIFLYEHYHGVKEKDIASQVELLVKGASP